LHSPVLAVKDEINIARSIIKTPKAPFMFQTLLPFETKGQKSTVV